MACSSVKRATFDYLASLEWISGKGEPLSRRSGRDGQEPPARRPRTAGGRSGKARALLHRPGADRDAHRGLADNSVGRVIEQILRADLILIDEIGFAPMDDTGVTAVLPHRRRRLRAPCARRSGHTGPSRSGDASCPSTPRRSACSTGCSITASSSSPKASRSA